jgi:hypothetical protein
MIWKCRKERFTRYTLTEHFTGFSGALQVNYEVSPTDSSTAGTIPYLWQEFVKPILFVSIVELVKNTVTLSFAAQLF